MTPAAAERARHLAIGVNRGKTPAPSRPALGFALDTTTLQETRAWARDHHVDCEDARPGLIKCAGVRPDVLGLPTARE